jgi:hypothetical protein
MQSFEVVWNVDGGDESHVIYMHIPWFTAKAHNSMDHCNKGNRR